MKNIIKTKSRGLDNLFDMEDKGERNCKGHQYLGLGPRKRMGGRESAGLWEKV